MYISVRLFKKYIVFGNSSKSELLYSLFKINKK